MEEATPAQPAFLGYEEKLQAARNLARQEPKAVASVIKDWLGGNPPAGKAQ
jgi:flagellar biosynthesis/type III secretory pathway M-ring protein FliF/YscJ